jgi:protein SCO1/2
MSRCVPGHLLRFILHPFRAAPVLVLGAALLGGAACRDGAAGLPGTDLGRTPAPDFRLTDQEGREVALADLRGRPVVLTFLYAACPDICPVTADKLRRTLDNLGGDAARVAVVAVSVDPERDDVAAARAFTDRHRLTGRNWHYLTGSAEQLAPVWAAYGVARLPRPGSAAAGASAVDTLGHTDALYLIDRDGRQRSLLRSDFDPDELARALRTLLR